MKLSADYRALALNALRGRWKTAVLAGLIASLLGANIVSSSDRVISNMSQNANGDTPGFAGLLSTGSGGAVSERDYRLVTRAEEQISDPPWFDALKTALMLALVVLLLALPFAPFMLLGRRAGQARALREAFDDADSRRAVCAMFRHVARYWAAYFPVPAGLPFSRLPEAADMPDDYAAAYRACADTFLKAAYSDAPITQAERDGVKILLDETERLLYDEQSALMQLKLRYRYLLR